MPRTKNPFRRRTPSKTNSRADVIRVSIESRRQALKIVAYAQVNCQSAGEGPMVLDESAKTRHRKIHGRIPERLTKLIRSSREEISERAKDIYAITPSPYVGTQSDAIHRSADLPTAVTSRARE